MNGPNGPQMPFMVFSPFGGGGSPPWMQQDMSLARQALDSFVPPRVDKAMEFVAMMMAKQQIRAVANDLSIEQIPGQLLSDDEANCLATACNCLSMYFAGKIKPDDWEKQRAKMIEQKIMRPSVPGRIINCIACHPHNLNPGCPLCRGSGTILVTPAGSPSPDACGHLHPDDDGPPEDENDC